MNMYDPSIRKVYADSLPTDHFHKIEGIPPGLEKFEMVKLITNKNSRMYKACVADIDYEIDCFWITFERASELWAA